MVQLLRDQPVFLSDVEAAQRTMIDTFFLGISKELATTFVDALLLHVFRALRYQSSRHRVSKDFFTIRTLMCNFANRSQRYLR